MEADCGNTEDKEKAKMISDKTAPGVQKTRKKRRKKDSSRTRRRPKPRLPSGAELGYLCIYCDSSLPTLQELQNHQESKRKPLPAKHHFKCDICSKTGHKSRESLIAHLHTHDGVTRLHLCKSCPMVNSTLDKLLIHMAFTHSYRAKQQLICPECDDFVSNSTNKLYVHCSEAHPDLKEKFDCHLCDKSFILQARLREHLKASHAPEPKQFLCSICTNGHNYSSKLSLDAHIRVFHTLANNLPFKCDQCEKSFIYKSLLQNHIDEKHNRIRYPCPQCSKSYSTQRHLEVHMRTHTGEGLFTCEDCGKQFPSEVQLKIHSVVHLKNDEQLKCVCETCGKSFPNHLRLKGHMKSHKEKNLECEYCHMMFRRRDNLRGHLRTHTGERPFICPICSKGFNRRDIMLIHMKMHGYGKEEASKLYDSQLEKAEEDVK